MSTTHTRQSPILRALPGGEGSVVKTWEADIVDKVAGFINGYLEQHPCPGPSEVAADLGLWAERLEHFAWSCRSLASDAAGRT
jgi:hypothetical protein